MAFKPKNRQRYHSLVQRERKVQALQAENTPESRRELKAMNDTVVRWDKVAVGDWHRPNKRRKHGARGKCKAASVRKVLAISGTI